ncbi:MAG: DUF192 domain-containing protein [Vicinamibacterales bacterium]
MRNERTGAVIADQLIAAFDSRSRREGLLTRTMMPAGTAMVIAPTNAIHTCFMKFPIDVAFVRRDGRIVKIREGLSAWRMTGAWNGYAAIEMAAGSFARTGTRVGDSVCITTPDTPVAISESGM